jgi:hypothetical protein
MVRHPFRGVVATTLLSLALVPAALAASSGSLSASEYQQLNALNTRLNRLSSADSASAISADARACALTHKVSQLVTGVAADCAAEFTLVGSLLSLESGSPKCLKDGDRVFRCFLPAYDKLYSRTSAFYGADLRARRIVLNRNLGDACASNLADPPKVFPLENTLTSIAAQMVIDVRAQQGKALKSDILRYAKDLERVNAGSSNAASILTGCAHR